MSNKTIFFNYFLNCSFEYEVILPDVNYESIHHILVYECNTNYKGVPALKPGDTTARRYCPIASLGYL
jgi:hypothetical protein